MLSEHIGIGTWVAFETDSYCRVGTIEALSPNRRNSTVKFGSDGPYETILVSKLRLATNKEIEKKLGG